MKAMILAAGHGKRMRPLTDTQPKPLLKVGGKPLIVWHIENLRSAGFSELVINMGWQGNKLPEALGNGADWGVSIQYSDEQDTGPLETAGGIFKALPLLGSQPFIVVNGDIWCNYPFQQLKLLNGDLAHLVLVDNPEHNPQGDFTLQNQRLLEKGNPRYTFSGIGLYHPDLFAAMQPGKAALAPLLYKAISNSKISGEYYNGDWRDIGTPQRLAELDNDLLHAQER